MKDEDKIIIQYTSGQMLQMERMNRRLMLTNILMSISFIAFAVVILAGILWLDSHDIVSRMVEPI